MIKDLDPIQKMLAEHMSEISERCYYAEWMENIEYVLWDAIIRNEQRKYGHDNVTKEDISILKNYAELANSWIHFDEELEHIALDLEIWKNKFSLNIMDKPSLLRG